MTQLERLKLICKSKKISLSRLERECNISKGYFSRCTKTGKIGADKHLDIARCLDISTYDLLHTDINCVLAKIKKEQEYESTLEPEHERLARVEEMHRLLHPPTHPAFGRRR